MWFRCDYELSAAVQSALFGAGPWSGTTYRRWVAKQNAALRLGIDPGVFNYDEGGRTLNGQGGVRTGAAVRFGWYPRGMALMGVGSEGVRLAAAVAPVIQSTLIRQSGQLIRANVRRGENTVAIYPRSVRSKYFTPAVVISPSGNGVGKWLAFVDEAKHRGISALMLPTAKAWAEQLMAEQLKQQLRMHDEGEEGVWASDEDEFAAARITGGSWDGPSPFNVQIHSAGEKLLVDQMSVVNQMISQQHGNAKRAIRVGFKNVELSVNAQLKGIWSVGRYLSHGYGMLFPASREWATEQKAA